MLTSSLGDRADHMIELKRDEPGLEGVRRILLERIARAGEPIYKKRVVDADIHNVRKQLKKARAALRLLRDAIGATAYRRENAALRDTARPLSTARDSKVLIATLDELVERYAPASQKLRLNEFRRVLRQKHAMARQAIHETSIDQQRTTLREVSSRVARWRMQGRQWQVIGGGLERVYRRGKKAMKVAARSRADEDLHDWRKQVKYLWHQLEILETAWPALLGELVGQTHKLANHLGDDHDLAVLREKIRSHADAFEANDRDTLVAMLERRRKQLQKKAFRLGARIYEEQPRRFVSRIGTYWRLWRKE